MKKLAVFFLFALFSSEVFSMPCDAGYLCQTANGKYKISLQRCRYRNSLHLISLTVNGSEVPGATLNQDWDGDYAMAFEIGLPVTVPGSVKILSAELEKQDKIGVMKVKYAESEPGPLEVLSTQKISCKLDD